MIYVFSTDAHTIKVYRQIHGSILTYCSCCCCLPVQLGINEKILVHSFCLQIKVNLTRLQPVVKHAKEQTLGPLV